MDYFAERTKAVEFLLKKNAGSLSQKEIDEYKLEGTLEKSVSHESLSHTAEYPQEKTTL